MPTVGCHPIRRSARAGTQTGSTSRRVSITPDPVLLSTQTALGPERLAAAELLRSDPPPWDALITRAERTESAIGRVTPSGE